MNLEQLYAPLYLNVVSYWSSHHELAVSIHKATQPVYGFHHFQASRDQKSSPNRSPPPHPHITHNHDAEKNTKQTYGSLNSCSTSLIIPARSSASLRNAR